jgi:serine/threonine-protein kinase ULK2
MIRKYPNPEVGGLNEVVCRHFLKQIASALKYLHARSFLHRDIKPQNLLLVPSPHWYKTHRHGKSPLTAKPDPNEPAVGIPSLPVLKIADFGFARFLPSLSLAETLCGSPLYMAPEILRYEKYDNKADLWSVGTVLHEMVVGKPPFRANNHVELLRKIEKAEDRIRFPEGSTISSEMKVAIRSLLKKKPTERISYEKFFSLEAIQDEIPNLVGEDRPLEQAPEPEPTALPRRPEQEPEVSPMAEALPERPEAGSRPSSYKTPRRLSGAFQAQKRLSEGRESPVLGDDSGPPSPRIRERRPTLTSHATAPGRQQEKVQSATPGGLEKPQTRTQPASMLKEHLDRERGRLDDKALKELREKAAQDIAFERDYVLVEKRSVEVNAFADELGHSPLVQQGAMVRRATTSGAQLSSTAPQSTATRAMQITGRQTPLHQRTGSYERRYGRSPTSATSAISKALNMANFRLFGMGLSPPSGKGPSPPHGYGAFPTYPTAQSSMLMIGDGGKAHEARDDDMRVAMHIEELATRSDVVWGFAEVKYQQLVPTRPLSTHGLGIGSRKGAEEPIPTEDDDLTVDAVVTISEEALVLYVKALAILAKVIDVAGSWWGHKNRGEIVSESPRSAPARHAGSAAVVAPKINGIVQWSRNRFNDCLEKSEFVGRKLVEAQRRLPVDHPGHPSNHPSMSLGSATSVGTSAENITLTSGVTAEKLMYDRALEMSRFAAVNELTNTDLEGGEVSYRTAIYMLEAILDSDDDGSSRGRGKKEKAEDELINGLESEDRATVMKRKRGRNTRKSGIC